MGLGQRLQRGWTVQLSPEAFGRKLEKLQVVRIQPQPNEPGEQVDTIGVVTTYEGDPLEAGDIASRLGGFRDIAALERAGDADSKLIEAVLGSKNILHDSYQDSERFLQSGGKTGLQHDPLRTGKYPINPRCYQPVIVPTSILTPNWAEAVSQEHNLGRNLSQIVARSREGVVHKIDLQVQIHVPDTKTPRFLSIVGSVQNLVNEVLQVTAAGCPGSAASARC